ncbi:MAG: Nucleotidyl transferase [Candidatus Falkowbacteria bacterium GW2011_GWC2_38_22]|uniref:Nucleotidyl transferase n=1 Tax=Candidatus Falkowbacteria bacterium GW2011_GWE1_38_31 TaxID=1618638 RepID=A0A0G0K2R5_9BACT|nr:MAG: Nucleotidyl transferase [Candidatus Falkowbacteria bacterium GW2011_GWF2_38_1205]KKQ60792.1 MAG: Nucleotidyl transferase [Candidatus Falkowbacteria bacterium GW2011_GWC2_38_22]KKQ62959.1 MAG: Nucleotidyl transferase [Candidatus Falkowbacteria bacterium GW2011_GWF1_38_22]KKQ64971.1 MAG: Nucleotidyl transferase [Candidatus Falkowbacteria bacterium GW2011_GWE2_38_254]KKQ69735.1 MAG: Nucleotidyl transferase [Candidatus Falkowbacteria bacterium GW2011_GWE1_38_31]KKQ72343.1 MAG: Nucleotidyl 
MKIVIRAGGIGTRLWPMSRKNNPKQFHSIVGDKTMLRTTYDRVVPILKNKEDVFISVNQDFVQKTLDEIPEISQKQLIVETDTRNTGPAMCLEVCFLEKFCDPNEIIASLPSDDYISNSEAFQSLLESTESFIAEHPDYILTPAIRPEYVDTGYSYFKAGKNLREGQKDAIYKVAGVAEKPNLEFCQTLIDSGVYYCHTGMYLWQLKHIVNLFKTHQKEMYDICTQVANLTIENKLDEAERLYSELEKISIETAITNHTNKIAMSVSNEIGWSDLGKWHIIKKVLKPDETENLIKGDVMVQDAKGNLIYSSVPKKIIVVNDVDDLAVIDTPDVLFISSLKNSAEVKKMVERLKDEGRGEYL